MSDPYRPVAGPCAMCGDAVAPNEAGTLREVTGWEKVRPGGGANQIRWRRLTGRFLCPKCRWLDKQPPENQLELEL